MSGRYALRGWGWIPLIAAGLFTVSGVAAAQTTGAEEGAQSLDSAVVDEMAARSGTNLASGERSAASSDASPGTQVNVMRESAADGTEWAFGSSLIEAPKKKGRYPEGWLFVAKNDGSGWETELEGTQEFVALADEAPEAVVSSGEDETFTAQADAVEEQENTRSTAAPSSPTRTGLMLPWKEGTAWHMTGGPHGWATGYDRPYAALDFVGRSGGDQNVRTSGAGRAYKMCGSRDGGGWYRVYHPNGLSTDYYHLWNTRSLANGANVKLGAKLGETGEDVCGGGAAYGRHVHYALLKGENHISLKNRIIGGWTFVQGEAYEGSAQRGNKVQRPGSLLKNFGPS